MKTTLNLARGKVLNNGWKFSNFEYDSNYDFYIKENKYYFKSSGSGTYNDHFRQKNISLIEWPEIIINNFNFINYHLINLKFINSNQRRINHQHFDFNVS